MSFPFIGCILGEQPITILRDPGGQTFGSDGRPVFAARAAVAGTHTATVLPVTGEQWQLLGLGGRRQDHKKFLSETPLESGDDKAATPIEGDHIVLADGRIYEIVRVADFLESPYPHWNGVGRVLDESAGDAGA